MYEDDFLEAAYEDRFIEDEDFSDYHDQELWDDDEPIDDDVEHDAWVLSSAGMGTDEDYGYYGETEWE